LPGVAPSVLDHRTAIAVWHVGWFFQGFDASLVSPTICFIGVRDVNVQKSRRRWTNSLLADHEHGIANGHDRRHVGSVLAGCLENVFQELHEVLHTMNDDSWYNVVPPLRFEGGLIRWLAHRRLQSNFFIDHLLCLKFDMRTTAFESCEFDSSELDYF